MKLELGPEEYIIVSKDVERDQCKWAERNTMRHWIPWPRKCGSPLICEGLGGPCIYLLGLP